MTVERDVLYPLLSSGWVSAYVRRYALQLPSPFGGPRKKWELR